MLDVSHQNVDLQSDISPLNVTPLLREITSEEYENCLAGDDVGFKANVGKKNVRISLRRKDGLQRSEPMDFGLEKTTVWSFPLRGDWCTHRGDYPGNWPPQVPRNIILRYSHPGDVVLDQMCGSGTTLVECKLLERNSVGVDINRDAIMLTRSRLDFKFESEESSLQTTSQRTYVGDARELDMIDDESIDLIATHPPYWNIITYSKYQEENDLSRIRDARNFLAEMRRTAEESYRVLKKGRICAFLMGDTRKHRHYIPLSYRTLNVFLNAGFLLREDIVKIQWSCSSTPFWSGKTRHRDFLLIMHEHLFILEKPVVKCDDSVLFLRA